MYSYEILLQNISKFSIQLCAKWQFCNKTHPPVFIVWFNIFSAFSPYPYPNDILKTFRISFSLAKLSKSVLGSDPEESSIINGVLQLESSYISDN